MGQDQVRIEIMKFLVFVLGLFIMHNCKIHVKVTSENTGISILFLPPYSPFINPIEAVFIKIKSQVKTTINEVTTQENYTIQERYEKLNFLLKLQWLICTQPIWILITDTALRFIWNASKRMTSWEINLTLGVRSFLNVFKCFNFNKCHKFNSFNLICFIENLIYFIGNCIYFIEKLKLFIYLTVNICLLQWKKVY